MERPCDEIFVGDCYIRQITHPDFDDPTASSMEATYYYPTEAQTVDTRIEAERAVRAHRERANR